jgi:DNA uptake protein ComE-like DNA-binding protein
MTSDAAAEIVKYRDTHGPFRTPRDLTKVPLFGEAAYHRLKDQLAAIGE